MHHNKCLKPDHLAWPIQRHLTVGGSGRKPIGSIESNLRTSLDDKSEEAGFLMGINARFVDANRYILRSTAGFILGVLIINMRGKIELVVPQLGYCNQLGKAGNANSFCAGTKLAAVIPLNSVNKDLLNLDLLASIEANYLLNVLKSSNMFAIPQARTEPPDFYTIFSVMRQHPARAP